MRLVVLLASLAALGAVACSDPSSSTPDAGVTVFDPDGGSGLVTSITVSPLPLVPTFAPDIEDYYVRCAAGTNSVTVTVTDTQGTATSAVDLAEDQAIVIRGRYWVRCLPHDFPQITVAHPSAGAPTPGYYLVNNAAYAMVLDVHGTPVWYARGTDVNNVDAPLPNVISLMPAGKGPFGTNPTSSYELHDLTSETTRYVRASGSPTDVHEMQLLPNGDALLFTYPIETGWDLTGLSTFGANEAIADCQIQEVSPSGALVWSWLASDHIDPVTESLEPSTSTVGSVTVRDVFHCNAIDADASGNLLVSFRHTNAVIYVDKTTGKILWKLGGTTASKDGAAYIQVVNDPNGPFSMQHDARLKPNGNVTLFDDHGASPGVARGVEYALDHTAGTATPVWQFLGTTQSLYEGGFRRYADGESVIGWGQVAPDARVITEVDAAGNDVLDISLDPQTPTYRGVKVPLSQLDIGAMRLTTAKW